MGHALHMEPGPFQDIVTCDRTKKLLKALGYNQVSIPQRIRSYQSLKYFDAAIIEIFN